MNSSGPEKTVRWGILGTAKIATKVGRAIHQARRARLAAVASRDIGRARAWVAEHTLGRPADDDKQAFLPDGSAVETFGGYLDLLKSTEIDAVYIPLPPALHCEWTCRAAELGKHVLCEKPLAMDHAEAEKMAAACAAQNRQLMDGVMFAHHDRTAAIEELLP